MRKAFVVFAAVLAVSFLSLTAEAGVIMIKNGTGFDIHQIFVSDSGAEEWEEDVLGNNILQDGQSLRLTVNGSYSAFDMKAADGEGNQVDWYEIPGNASQLVIYSDGTCEYQ